MLEWIGPDIVKDGSYLTLLEESSMGTPQYRALDWLANHDLYELNSTQFSIEQQKDFLIERYAVAVFFFATGGGGKSWNMPNGFMDPNLSICDWGDFQAARGVFCLYKDDDMYKESITHLMFSKSTI